MIRAADVLAQTFRTARLREGYEMEAVDDLLDAVAGALSVWEAGGLPGPDAATSGTLRASALPTTRFREGYDTQDVDDYLSELAATLEQWERRAAAVPADAPTLGLRALTSQLQIATVRTHGADDVRVVTPGGVTLRVVAVEADASGVTVRTAPVTG